MVHFNMRDKMETAIAGLCDAASVWLRAQALNTAVEHLIQAQSMVEENTADAWKLIGDTAESVIMDAKGTAP